MTGGLGKIHRGHFSSLGIASEYFAQKRPRDKKLQELYCSLPKSEIGICAKLCIMFKDRRCESTGRIAPVGKDCEAQLISRRER